MTAAWRASGEPKAEFARRFGLDVQRVYRWIAQVEGEAPTAAAISFAPVRFVGDPAGIGATPSTGLEIVVGAAVLRVERDFDADHLRHVVAALGGDEC